MFYHLINVDGRCRLVPGISAVLGAASASYTRICFLPLEKMMSHACPAQKEVLEHSILLFVLKFPHKLTLSSRHQVLSTLIKLD